MREYPFRRSSGTRNTRSTAISRTPLASGGRSTQLIPRPRRLSPARAARPQPRLAPAAPPTSPMVAILRRASLAQAQTSTVARAGVLSIAGLTAWLAIVGESALLASHDILGSMATARGRAIGPAVILAVVGLFICEQRWPAVRRPVLARAHVVDATYFCSRGFSSSRS